MATDLLSYRRFGSARVNIKIITNLVSTDPAGNISFDVA
jgi:hypothetical protein